VSKTSDLSFYYLNREGITDVQLNLDLLKAHDGVGGNGVYVVDAKSEDGIDKLNSDAYEIWYRELEVGKLVAVLGNHKGEYLECIENIHFNHQLILKGVSLAKTEILSAVKIIAKDSNTLPKIVV
jgi:hypothetical protein